MGAGQSTTANSSQTPPRALHVLRVTPSSPASRTSIEPFFDFVVGFQGDDFSSTDSADATELEKIVENHEGRTLNLLVWNSKSQQTRVVPIVPSRDWALPHTTAPDPQEPEAGHKPSLLGLSMRICQPELALDNVWHVLDVLEGSPAESAGLVPYGDWIIGWSGGVLSAEGDFYEVVENHIEKPLRVYVYSYDFDTIREVVLVPNRHWGGEGLLGCVFGFGLLHRIPPIPPDREPGSTPPELSEEYEGYEDQQLFVPADYHGESEVSEQDLDEEELRWQQEEWMRRSYASASSYEHVSANGNETISAYARPVDDSDEPASLQDEDEDSTVDDRDDDNTTNDCDGGSGGGRASEEQFMPSSPLGYPDSADEQLVTAEELQNIPSNDISQPIPASRNNHTIPKAIDLRDTSQSPPPDAPEDVIDGAVRSTPVPVHVTPVRPAFSPFRVGSPRIGSPRPSTPTPRLGSFSFMNGDSSRPS
ncbi:GRASP55/65 PDZ-like domain-containing protein [Fomitopsis serialis]|uniref:GRASP55/65 PDZ-like domain-containing protein n=1 Tax=Fomitopsis serialis TaxID=139415 RepID=UPI0020072870|nr:GRASP55/65 PDZ-like domain-containing protein [Neoantrodia serialis]KAH9925560.1 GRASP55/65 PDZ-like domain-containing protein [Neoantrodia serialis]